MVAVNVATGAGAHSDASVGSMRAERILSREAHGTDGTRGLAGLKAIESVSRRVVNEAHCSVMLVTPECLQGYYYNC